MDIHEVNMRKRVDFERAPQTLVQPLLMPAGPELVHRYYSITLEVSAYHEAQGKDRVLLEWGSGDGGEKQPHTEHRVLLLRKFPLGISVHSDLLACQLAIPLSSPAAPLRHCRSPAVLPPGSLCSPWP